MPRIIYGTRNGISGFPNKPLPKWVRYLLYLPGKNLTPLKERIMLIDKEEEILPGVKVFSAPGHTPGHMVISFQSGGKQLLYTADTVLHPLHLDRPDWVPVYDILPDLALKSKNLIFDFAAETSSMVLGQHFPPFRNLGYIAKQEIGWAWQPIEIKV
jgi:glyoxylase-like metal-dependent hydrolase (beta-lactamase superfamily II)